MTVPAKAERTEIQPYEYSVADVKAQVKKIQEIMKDVMKEGEHYGVIPGTQKPTLLKPGAEKLSFTFRFDPEYEELPSCVFRDDYIHYRLKCTLFHIGTGKRIASGVGSCNSKEAKYRYRWMPGKPPDKPTQESMKGNGTGGWRKIKGNWVWHVRTENENPADQDNTLFKMAAKRALVAAVLNATAASDIFTQDLEDYQVEEAKENQEPIQQDQPQEGSEAGPEADAGPQNEQPVAAGVATDLRRILTDHSINIKELPIDLTHDEAKLLYEAKDKKALLVKRLHNINQFRKQGTLA